MRIVKGWITDHNKRVTDFINLARAMKMPEWTKALKKEKKGAVIHAQRGAATAVLLEEYLYSLRQQLEFFEAYFDGGDVIYDKEESESQESCNHSPPPSGVEPSPSSVD